jgi:hypothetical protein
VRWQRSFSAIAGTLSGAAGYLQGIKIKTAIPGARTLQELRRKVNRGTAAGIRRSAAGIYTSFEWRDALLNPFQRDMIRMIALLFGPMLVGAVVIPLLMITFAFLGYPY